MIKFPPIEKWSGQLLKNVQKIVGVKEDGIYGKDTEKALKKYLDENQGPPSWLPSFGFDVSHHNGVLSQEWFNNKVKEGYTFCYVKVSEGGDFIDKYAIQNIKWAFASGLKVGTYHFGRPDGDSPNTLQKDASKEVKNYLKNISSVKDLLTLKHCLDLENRGDSDPDIKIVKPLTGDALVEWTMDWLSLINNHILYTSKSWLETYVKKLPKDFPIWVAAYHSGTNPNIGDRKWLIWQHSISGNLDQNVADPSFLYS